MKLKRSILKLSESSENKYNETSSLISQVNKAFRAKLGSNSVQISQPRQDITSKLPLPNTRAQELLKAHMARKKLEEKLLQVSNAISSLSKEPKSQSRQILPDERTNEKLKQYRLEQVQRQKRTKAAFKKLEERIEIEESLEKQRQKDEELEKEVKKNQRLEEISLKSFERKERLEALPYELKKGVKTEPLFKIKSKHFEEEQKALEELRRQEILQKRKQLYAPVNLSSIRENQDKHKLQSSPKESFVNETIKIPNRIRKVIERDNQEKLANIKKQKYKLELLDKQKRYAKMVHLVHLPSVDEIKQKEMELILEKMTSPIKWKGVTTRNLSIPSKRIKRVSKSVNSSHKPSNVPKVEYLKDQKNTRSARDQSFLRSHNKVHDLSDIKHIKDLESDVYKKEQVLNRLKKENPNDASLIDAEDQINSLLLSSLHAKFSFLH